MALPVRKLATWPRACTPASVRPEPIDRHRRLRQPGHRRFQHPLDGGGLELALPAVIAAAVVFQEEADIASGVHVRWLFWRKIRKIARG